MIGIYKITNPEGKSYIGLSKNIELRWKSHKNLQFKGNIKLRESLTLYGGDSHLFTVIEEINISNLSLSEGNSLLRQKERYWIKKLDTFYKGLNENGGGSGCGSHTSESKLKISNALKGKPKPEDFGEKRSKSFYTEEWKNKVSKSNKGRESPMKGKIGPNKGKVMSIEQKLKISKSNKGKPKPKNFLLERKKQVICLNNNQIYESISEAAKYLNLPISGVSQCCREKRKSCKGYKFKFNN
jgi:group I intron endonuclease